MMRDEVAVERRTAAPGLRSAYAPAIVGAGAVIAVGTLFLFGVTARELILFAGFEAAFAIVPGFILFVVLRGRPRGFADALTIAWPLGLAAELGCFVLTAAIGERWLFSVYPAIVVAAAAPLLWLRRRRQLVGPARWRIARETAVPVGLVVVGVACVMALDLFAPSPLPRDTASVSYYPDLVFDLSLAAEILHHWSFMDPSVYGQPLHYHIFANIDMAAVAQVTRLELSTIALRLQPYALIGLIAVQLFAVGRKVGGSRAVGLVAVALGLFAGELNFSRRVGVFGGGASVLSFPYSPSYELGAVFFLAGLMLVLEGLASPKRPSARYLLTLTILSLGAVGAKTSAVVVLAGGLALFALGRAAAHRRIIGEVGALAVVILAGALGYVLMYSGGGSQGLGIKPFDFVRYSNLESVYASSGHSLLDSLALPAAAVIVICGSLVPVIGAGFVGRRWWRRGSSSTAERLCMCMFAASLVPYVLLGIPGDSEEYFLVYGFLAAVVVSAVGIVDVGRALRLRGSDVAWPAVVLTVGLVVLVVGLWRFRSAGPLVAGFGLLAVVIATAVWLVRRRMRDQTLTLRRASLALAALVTIALTVFAGTYQLTAPTIDRWLHGLPAAQASGVNANRGLTTQLWRGLVWIRDHTRPSDVLAVNNHYLGRAGVSRYYYYSAFTERRVALESWDYTPQGLENLSRGRPGTPFPKLLAINNAVVERGSLAAATTLWRRYAVRYVVIDRVHGPAPSNPSALGRLVYGNSAVSVYRIR